MNPLKIREEPLNDRDCDNFRHFVGVDLPYCFFEKIELVGGGLDQQ